MIIKKWVAHLDQYCGLRDSKVKCFQVEVSETPKQFRLSETGPAYRSALQACGGNRIINKDSNIWLFDTEQQAMSSLLYHTQLREARLRINHAQALENRKKVEAAPCTHS